MDIKEGILVTNDIDSGRRNSVKSELMNKFTELKTEINQPYTRTDEEKQKVCRYNIE